MPSEPGLVAAIVLARGGSKGLPRKNVLPIAGKPCVRWTIDQALDAGTTDLVVVSSDDAEVLSIAADARARTHLRGPELASDTATVDAAARCAATDLEADTLVILYGNVPVRPADLIDRAVRALGATGADSVQSFARVGKHHPWWTARLDEATGLVGPWEGDRLNHGVHRRQDLPPAYIPDGGVIALTRDALFRRIERVEPGPHAFLGLDKRGIATAEGDVIDIDSRIDLLVADAVLRERLDAPGAGPEIGVRAPSIAPGAPGRSVA